jgi:uncharacterized protein YdaU (DUF1376 family)
MNYYPFHLNDYAAHTAHLSNEEDLCYRRAIDLYMMQEGPLLASEANAKRTLSRRLRVDEQTLQSVLDEFFVLTENGWENARCEEEIAKFQAKSTKAKEAGRLGGKRSGSKRQANAKRSLSERQANVKLTNNQEPLTKNQEPIKEKSLTLPFEDTDFADAWKDWAQHRKEKKKPLTPTSIKLQLQTLEDMGVDRAIRAIDHSIAQGWTGIFEPTQNGKSNKQQELRIKL